MADGILLVKKSAGPTSHDLVNEIRRAMGEKRVGHTGTLDPGATGLMVMLLGKATRLARWIQTAEKAYQGTIRLGVATDTLDAQGKVLLRRPCEASISIINEAAKSLTGEIKQTPPNFSAVKVNGRRAYSLARKGEKIRLKARTVNISEFKVALAEPGKYPRVDYYIACSSGTYVRTIASDLGQKVGCPAHLESLQRVRVGKFSIEESVSLDDLMGIDEKARKKRVLSMRSAVDLPEVFADAENIRDVEHGREITVDIDQKTVNAAKDNESVVKIISAERGVLLALGGAKGIDKERGRYQVKPFLVFCA